MTLEESGLPDNYLSEVVKMLSLADLWRGANLSDPGFDLEYFLCCQDELKRRGHSKHEVYKFVTWGN